MFLTGKQASCPSVLSRTVHESTMWKTKKWHVDGGVFAWAVRRPHVGLAEGLNLSPGSSPWEALATHSVLACGVPQCRAAHFILTAMGKGA